MAGDRVQAEALDAQLAALHDKLFIEPNPIPVKWALNKMGRIPQGIRLPLTELDVRYQPVVLAAMESAGVIK